MDVSKCCGAPVQVVHGPVDNQLPATSWHECTKCGEPCDIQKADWDDLGGDKVKKRRPPIETRKTAK